MMPKKHRLSSRLFEAVFSRGRRGGSGAVRYHAHTAPDGVLRIAVAISKKNAKSAVARHRARRRGYHALREALTRTPLSTTRPLHIIFFLTEEGTTLSFHALVENFTSLLRHVQKL